MKRLVVFIHDVGQTPACWSPFIGRYGACGYLCQAPAWPPLSTAPDDASSRPAPSASCSSAGWRGLNIRHVVDHYANGLDRGPPPPLLVGHGLGGLIVQLLLDRGLGAAGIALSPTPRRGCWQLLAPPPPSPIAPCHDGRQAPVTPRRLLLEAALGIGTAIDYANDERSPLLLVSAGRSRRVSSARVEACYRRHRRSMATTTLLAFPQHGDGLIVEPGWEAVADATLHWAQRVALRL
ncbi:alpha/beta fold hydrolase [Salinicola socius]|uniref:AB hydrolase-1 domain-containing protein n=1 Tax=Salinicola socius TaxID=404433 RepID=A0A1Q8SWH4_9GAMM|nr:alpha/beta fold hydrolase [Salinicola socius]OLO05815.1 hypothetical protein BTW07_02410 [Salinicola socius]